MFGAKLSKSAKLTSKGLAWCCAKCCAGAKQTSKDKVVRVLCGYIYQANAWFGGGRVFEIEFQFQLVLSLVLGVGAKLSNGAKQTSKGLVLSKDKVRVPSR